MAPPTIPSPVERRATATALRGWAELAVAGLPALDCLPRTLRARAFAVPSGLPRSLARAVRSHLVGLAPVSLALECPIEFDVWSEPGEGRPTMARFVLLPVIGPMGPAVLGVC